MFPRSLAASTAASTHVDLASTILQYCGGRMKMEGGVGLYLTHHLHSSQAAREIVGMVDDEMTHTITQYVACQ